MQNSVAANQAAVVVPLMRLHDELEQALNQGRGYQLIWDSLKQLDSYLRHYADELRGWLLSHLTCLDLSRAHYQAFLCQIRDWVDEYHQGINILAIEIICFIQRWLRL